MLFLAAAHFVLRGGKHSEAYHEYRWDQKHEQYVSIYHCIVHAIRMVVTVNKQ